jgi:MFS family permease
VFAAFGLIGTSFHVGISTAITELSPVAFRGRIFSLYSALQGPLIVLSIALGAPLAREYGAKDVFFVSGGLEIIVGIIAIAFAGKIISRPEIEEAVA